MSHSWRIGASLEQQQTPALRSTDDVCTDRVNAQCRSPLVGRILTYLHRIELHKESLENFTAWLRRDVDHVRALRLVLQLCFAADKYAHSVVIAQLLDTLPRPNEALPDISIPSLSLASLLLHAKCTLEVPSVLQNIVRNAKHAASTFRWSQLQTTNAIYIAHRNIALVRLAGSGVEDIHNVEQHFTRLLSARGRSRSHVEAARSITAMLELEPEGNSTQSEKLLAEALDLADIGGDTKCGSVHAEDPTPTESQLRERAAWAKELDCLVVHAAGLSKHTLWLNIMEGYASGVAISNWGQDAWWLSFAQILQCLSANDCVHGMHVTCTLPFVGRRRFAKQHLHRVLTVLAAAESPFADFAALRATLHNDIVSLERSHLEATIVSTLGFKEHVHVALLDVLKRIYPT